MYKIGFDASPELFSGFKLVNKYTLSLIRSTRPMISDISIGALYMTIYLSAISNALLIVSK